MTHFPVTCPGFHRESMLKPQTPPALNLHAKQFSSLNFIFSPPSKRCSSQLEVLTQTKPCTISFLISSKRSRGRDITKQHMLGWVHAAEPGCPDGTLHSSSCCPVRRGNLLILSRGKMKDFFTSEAKYFTMGLNRY